MYKRLTIAIAALTFAAACSQDPTSNGSTNEVMLAQNSQQIADGVAASRDGGTNCDGWVRRLIDTLRTTDDPQARMYLDSARINRDSAWAAWQRGDTAAARVFRKAAFRDVLSAVIELFPAAPARTAGRIRRKHRYPCAARQLAMPRQSQHSGLRIPRSYEFSS